MRMVHCGGYSFTEDNETVTSSAHTTLVMDDNGSTENGANSAIGDRYLPSTQQQQQETSYIYSECKNLYSNHWVIILAICSLVFLLFTTAMGWEQLEAIETGKGKIARMQSASATTGGGELLFKTVTTEFNEMFGGDSPHPTWHWFLPLTIQFPRGMRKVVLGYECQETTARPNDRSEDDDNDDNGEDQHGQNKDDDEADALLLRRAEAGQGVSLATSPDKADAVPISPYTGRPVEPLPLMSRRSNSRSRTASSSSTTSHDHNDEHGITLVDRTKARLA